MKMDCILKEQLLLNELRSRGLTFAAEAVRDGHEVVIYDKNSKPGGVVALLEHEGYKFEQGPLLIGDMLEGEPIYELLKSLGFRWTAHYENRKPVCIAL